MRLLIEKAIRRIRDLVITLLLFSIACYVLFALAEYLSQGQKDGNVSIEADAFGDRERSGRWRRIRREHLEIEPDCAACGTMEALEVHHILAFSEYPELELARGNLITLCREHHWLIGHDADGPGPEKPNWQTSNREVVEHAHVWAESGGW